MKEETDPRMKELTAHWCEVAWKDLYGLVYPWSGKDAKLLQATLSWCDKNFGKDESVQRIRTGIEKFLGDGAIRFTQTKHSFWQFASDKQRWIERPIERPRIVQEQKKEPEAHCGSVDWEAWLKREIDVVNNDPVMYMRGFSITSKMLKKIHEPTYAALKKYLIDLLGKERSLKIYREATNNMAPLS